MTMTTHSDLFDEVLEAPDPDLAERYGALVGIDEMKVQIEQQAALLLVPETLIAWSKEHYGLVLPAVDDVAHRTPLLLLGGDVGTGKTAVATTFPDAVARDLDLELTVYHLGLSSRGQGAVGEMTKRIGAAFAEVAKRARSEGRSSASQRHGAVLVIDEADSVAQSRDLDQMHHEDRAGVNAIIRGIDTFASPGVAALCVMCSNRLSAIDPAVQRRAALSLSFERPNRAQRLAVLQSLLGPALRPEEYEKLADATGERKGGSYGYTFSDLRTRLLPELLVRGLSHGPITLQMAIDAADELPPTAPFGPAQ